ncbi:hypothetical protein B0H15DRAFT_805895 [Mycena belliarum]|uniref:Uncharacterized protein n=1 Tax=Mycena belliarum TaxID=1033014 RepID=A0AAD6XHY7_9AGAR|nr:hypothetical protein B0H15DRAFT_805895 [Mycena belliae]
MACLTQYGTDHRQSDGLRGLKCLTQTSSDMGHFPDVQHQRYSTGIMEEWQYPDSNWDEVQRYAPAFFSGAAGSSQPQTASIAHQHGSNVRRLVIICVARLPFPANFDFPSDTTTPSFDPADSGHLFQSDSFAGTAFSGDISVQASDDAALLSWQAQSSYQPGGSRSDDPPVQPWEDFISSVPSQISHVRSDAGDLFDGYGDAYGFPSAPPSSIPDDENWTNRSQISPLPEQNLDLIDEAADMDARIGWEWKPSGVEWLDPEVSSEVVEFPDGTPLTDKLKVFAVHRVKGCPSQFPFYRRRTAFFVNFMEIPNLDPEMTVDNIIRDQHVGEPLPSATGYAHEERRELDPEPGRKLAAATLRTRSTTLSKAGAATEFVSTARVHSSARILDHVSEDLLVKVMNGQRIIDEDDTKGSSKFVGWCVVRVTE